MQASTIAQYAPCNEESSGAGPFGTICGIVTVDVSAGVHQCLRGSAGRLPDWLPAHHGGVGDAVRFIMAHPARSAQAHASRHEADSGGAQALDAEVRSRRSVDHDAVGVRVTAVRLDYDSDDVVGPSASSGYLAGNGWGKAWRAYRGIASDRRGQLASGQRSCRRGWLLEPLAETARSGNAVGPIKPGTPWCRCRLGHAVRVRLPSTRQPPGLRFGPTSSMWTAARPRHRSCNSRA